MKRGLVVCTVAMLCGIYTACLFPDFIPMTLLFSLLFLFLVASFFNKRARAMLLALLFFLSGGLMAHDKDDASRRPLYPYLNEYVTVTAEVIRKPEPNALADGYNVTARVVSLSFLEEKDVPINETVLLAIKNGEAIPQFGQRFTAVCLFYEPSDAMNEGGFDYAVYLKSKNIFFRGTVENGTAKLGGAFPLRITERMYRLNQRAGSVVNSYLPADAAAVTKAMVLGDANDISASLDNALRISGLSHMISVSGMHTSVLVSTLYGIFNILGGGRRRRRNILVLIVILFFVLFTGASPAAVRAGIMTLLSVAAQLLWRKEDSLTSLATSALVLAVINPLVVFDAGFMLSYAATLGIVLLSAPLYACMQIEKRTAEKPKWIQKLASYLGSYSAVTVSAQLFLLPVSATVFGYTTLWAFLAGFLAMPLGSVILIGGALLCIIGFLLPMLAVLVAGFVYPFVRLFLYIVRFFGSLEWGIVVLGSFSALGLYVYALGLFSLERFTRRMWRQTAVVMLSIAVLLSANFAYITCQRETASVTFINVGQGDCALIRLSEGVDILIDGGGMAESIRDYDVGEQVVLPYLRKRGVQKLEYVVASHPHTDHIGGLDAVLEAMPVENLLVPIGFEEVKAGKTLLECAAAKNISVSKLANGDVLKLSEDAKVETLMPSAEWLAKADSDNDKSLVLSFTFGEMEVLFTGDLEQDGEAYLAESAEGGVHIIKVGHHGSNNATSDVLLAWAEPRYAYISCGENQFGHPSEAVLERLEIYGTKVYRADIDKDVRFVLDKANIRLIRKGGGVE